MSHVVLYTDATRPAEGGGPMVAAVCTVDRTLVQWDRIRGRDNRRAELAAVLLAARYAKRQFYGVAKQPGIILTDCFEAAQLLGIDRQNRTRQFNSSRYRQQAEAILKALPHGWLVAWIPRSSNLANAALRRVPDEPRRKVDG